MLLVIGEKYYIQEREVTYMGDMAGYKAFRPSDNPTEFIYLLDASVVTQEPVAAPKAARASKASEAA